MTLFLLARLGAFLCVPLLYLLLDLVNDVQAAQTAALGMFALLAVSAATASRPQGSRGSTRLALMVALPFLAILALQGFLRDIFGVAPDDDMVLEALFNTNGGEAGEFLLHNARAIGFHLAILAGFLLLLALLLRLSLPLLRPAPSPPARRRRAWWALGFALLFLLLHLDGPLRKDDPLLFFPLRYADWHRNVESTRALLETLGRTARDPLLDSLRLGEAGPRTVVLVLGESTTRANLSLYGYPRPTTPALASLGEELLACARVSTCYPGTVGAIRLMLTPADIPRPDLWMTSPDILTMAKRVGYKTFWLSNHSPRGVVSVFAAHADVTRFVNRGGSRNEGSFDEVLLPPYRQALDDPAPLKLIVLHMLGGHPAARFRYPQAFARFDGADDGVARAMRGEGRSFWAIAQRGHYDNAMLYADSLLKATIDLLRDRGGGRAAWIFTPDHGEDVAHHTDYVGHNHRVPEGWEIPLLLWERGGEPRSGTLRRAIALRPWQTDQLDHTLLGLLGIGGGNYDPRRDILSPLFEPLPLSRPGLPGT